MANPRSIGTRSTDAVTIDAVTGSGPWTVTLSAAVPSTTHVGDKLTKTNDWLITAISGSDLTVADELGAGGAPTTGSGGVTGRTYSDITTWEAATDNDLSAAPQTGENKGELHDDSARFDTSAVVIEGATNTSATNFRHLTAYTPDRHSGDPATVEGPVVNQESVNARMLDLAEPYGQISWFMSDANNATWNNTHQFRVNDDDASLQVHHIIWSQVNYQENSGMIHTRRVAGDGEIAIHNCMIWKCGTRTGGTIEIKPTTVSGTKVINLYNVTVHDCEGSSGSDRDQVVLNGDQSGTTYNIKNLLITDPETDGVDYDSSLVSAGTLNEDNIWTSDTTSPTSDGSKTATTEMNDPANGDLSLKSGATAIDAGNDLGSVYEIDIAGNTRSGTWDVGAFEFQAVAAALPKGTHSLLGVGL